MTASRLWRGVSPAAHWRSGGGVSHEFASPLGTRRWVAFAALVAGAVVLPVTAHAQAEITWAASYSGTITPSHAGAPPTSSMRSAPSRTPGSHGVASGVVDSRASTERERVHRSEPRRAASTVRSSGRSALPDVAEAQVEQWATAYSTTYRASFVRAISRGQPYGAMIAAKLRNAGLPGALIYLPVVESRFSASARSRAGAVGLWQFMAGTARGYGLRVDAWVDERRDPYRATDAAVHYLRDLHDTFGDWYLALAAYNSGDGRVTRAVRSSGSAGSVHAFWAAQGNLPRETREYVPQLLGVARVGANPGRYGVAIPDPSPERDLVRIILPPASRLTALAQVWGISLAEIAQLNPALNWAATPPDRNYAIIVPATNASEKRDQFLALPQDVRRLSAAEIARIAHPRQ